MKFIMKFMKSITNVDFIAIVATALLVIFLETVFFASIKYSFNLNTEITVTIAVVSVLVAMIGILYSGIIERYIVPLVSHIKNIGKLSTKDDMKKTISQIKELNNKIDNDILSPNHHKDSNTLESKILKKLITMKTINDIRVDNLLYEKSYLGFASKKDMPDLTAVILSHFNDIKNYKHAIAHCVINNTSLINSDMHLFEYFIRHFIYTKHNLNIHRIFSIRAMDIKPNTGNIVNNNSLLFYLIANYIAGVRVYLHVDNRSDNDNNNDNNNDNKLLDLDYVAAHYIDDDYKFKSKIYLSPKDNKTTKDEREKLVEIDNEFYLQSIFEEDYKQRLLLQGKGGFIEVSPERYNDIENSLQLSKSDREIIKDTFIKKINDIPTELDAEQNKLDDIKKLELSKIAGEFFNAIPTRQTL